MKSTKSMSFFRQSSLTTLKRSFLTKKKSEEPRKEEPFSREIKVRKGNPFHQWVHAKSLGGGGSGTVELYGLKHNYVAIKEFASNSHGRKEFYEELNAFKSLPDHKYVVRFLGAFQTEEGMRIVLEYCSQGDLNGIWEKLKRYDEFLVREVVVQVISGLKFMYENKVAHRDIKPDNILVKCWEPVHVLIGDLNYARTFQGGDLARTTVFTTKLGTRDYRAPEILSDSLKTHVSKDRVAYNHKCDIWSMGVVLYQLLSCNNKPYQPTLGELISLKETFDKDDELEVAAAKLEFRRIKDNEVGFAPVLQWNKITDEGRDLVKRMLMNLPADRIDYDQILEHSWTTVDLFGRGDIFDRDVYQKENEKRLEGVFSAFNIDTKQAKEWMFQNSYYG